MAKVIITDDYTTGSAGLFIEHAEGRAMLGANPIDFGSANFPFGIPSGVSISSNNGSADFIIYGDDAGIGGPSGLLPNAISDGAAATSGVLVGGFYRNGGDVRIRLS